MKTLKYLLFLVLILIIGGAIYVAIQPNTYDIARTKLIKAPANMVFNNVNDYKNWPSWGPWYEQDSTIEATYSDQTSGVGGSYSWTSKDGPGSMNTVGVENNKSLAQKLQFGDYEPTDVNWSFEETPEGTNVTWNMKADEVPFMFKMFGAMSGGMDNMLGPMLDRGLVKLDSIMQIEVKKHEEMKSQFKLSEIREVNLPAQKFIGYYQKTKIDHEAMTKLFMENMPKAGQYAMTKLKYGEFIPASVYTSWDEEKGEAEFYIGVLLKKHLAPGEGMTAINLPAGKTVTVSKFGNYGTGDYEAHTAIYKYLKDNNLNAIDGKVWELYVNDPTQVKPEDIQTDIYYAVK